MDPEGSLPYSQELTVGSFFCKIHFNFNFLSMFRRVITVGQFNSGIQLFVID
jgi:hypothetical protein